MQGHGVSKRHIPPRYQELNVQADFDDFVEIDEKFPINYLPNIEGLELGIRSDLEFKFLLVISSNYITQMFTVFQ